MLRIALTALWSRKRRLVGTTLAVVLGVTFLSATLILSDTTRAGFTSAFVDANAGIDARVRSSLRLSGSERALPTPLDASIVGLVSSVPGVARVAPSVEGTAQIVGADGTPLGGNGPPTVGAAWIDEPGLTPYALAEGRAPHGRGEVVIDRGSATEGKLAVGATTIVLTPAPVPVTVVGTATFAGEDSLGGVSFAAFTLDEAQRVILGGRRQVTSVEVEAADGVRQDELVMRLASVLPPGVEAISGDDLTAEQRAEIEGDFLGFMETALLAFAAVALLVAGFSIYNTFAVLAAQRSRESALLRALGASRVQVLGAGLAEAVVVGLAGCALGLAAGAGVALGAQALLEANGFGLPEASLRVGGSTMVIATVVGTLVAVIAALVPAWRASRVAPLAALRAIAVEAGSPSRWRIVVGAALGAAGTFLVLGRSISGAGLGALVVVVAVVVCGPALARPVVSVLTAPIGLRGVAGDLARRNALRNPRRTSATSAALLVGVAVVTLFVVFGASVSASIEESVDRSFGGDLVVESSGFSGAGLSPALLDEVRALPQVDAAAGLGFGAVLLDGADEEAGFADVRALDAVADFEVVEGSMAAVGPGRFAVSRDTVEEHRWRLGQRVPVGFADGMTEELEIAAVYDDRAIGDDILLPVEPWSAHVPHTPYALILVGLADGVDLEEGRRALAAVTARHGEVPVRDRDEFVESQAAEVDALLAVIYGLLAVAIVIALIGIANTLSLAVHERTRELGLQRAVGQSRRQMRSMVRWESVIIATFGSVGGVSVGVLLGWGLVRALHAAEGLGTFLLPTASVVTVVVLGAAVGLVAGLRPAWRASRLPVLAAIAAE